MIKVEDLVKRYDKLIAVNHLSFEIKQGEIFGILGPNGSGKSTLINCILSILKYESGKITILEEPMKPSSYHIKKRIGIVPQQVAVLDDLNVEDNIDYFCGLYIEDAKRRKELVDEAIAFVGIEKYRKFKPKKLSGGILRRLNIACGIAHKPDIIIFDEPTVAIDPQSRENILLGIETLRNSGATIIYTSHYIDEVERICDRVMIIDEGKLVEIGDIDSLKGTISYTELIEVKAFHVSEEFIKKLQNKEGVAFVGYEEDKLFIKTNVENSLLMILNMLKEYDVEFMDILSTKPSLNDVFLEITGKELRD